MSSLMWVRTSLRATLPMLEESCAVQVMLDLLLEEVGLTDEKIGGARGVRQRLGPLK